MGINTTSFSNTPQAKDDLFDFNATGLTEDTMLPVFLNVMSNDLGGNAKTLWSLDDAMSASTPTSIYAPADLLAQDTARTEAASTDYSANGAHIWITADGKVGYDLSTANPTFKAALQALAVGEFLTDKFTYAIRLGNGTLSWATATVKIAGTNDGVFITSSDQFGAVTEDADTTASSNDSLSSSGLISFKDIDLSDTHTATFTPNTNNTTALGTFVLAPVNEAANAETGSVQWTYNLNNAAAQYLASGQTVVENYTVIINDGHGNTASQTVAITITGTNDAPIIDGTSFFGAVTEAVTPNEALSTNGTINFSDVDLTDVHTLSPITAPAGALGTMTASVTTDTTGTGNGGVIAWNYSVDSSAVEYLAAGQTKVETFSFDLLDGQGASVTRTISVTITGTNDAPQVALTDLSGEVTEQLLPAGNLSDTGTITFSDVDLTDIHTVSAITASAGALGTLSASVTADTTGTGNGGVVTWNYSVDSSAVEYLAAGQTKVESFTFDLLDGQGASVTRTVSITITGTNDIPQVAMTDLSGEVTEQINAADALTDSGTIAFSDVDLTDVHTVGAITASAGALGTLSASVTTDTTGTGSNGVVTWNYSVDSRAVEYLAAGQTKIETFTFDLLDGQGASVTRTVTITITGTNDVPEVSMSDLSGEVSEQITAGGNLTDAGTISFSDVDLNDTHTLSAISASAGALGTLTANVTADTTGTGSGGVVTWNYSVDSSAVEYLAAGETKVETFSFDLIDDQGASVTRTVSVTITGTNDAPIVAMADLTGVVTEQITPAGNVTDSGSIAFTDSDLADQHSVSAVTASSGALGTLVASVTTDTTGTGNGGLISWNYSVPDTAIEYLSAGQTKVETFNFDVTDGQGASVTRSVSVTLQGTNDVPVITSQDLTGAVTAVPVAAATLEPIVFTVQQFLGFQSNNLATLRSYAATHTANYTVQTNVIDYTDDPAGFSGDIPGSTRWPAAAAQNVNGTGGINNNFFARITSNFVVDTTDTYTFRTYNDDGAFLLIDNVLIINDTGYHPEAPFTGSIVLTPGTHTIELFFYEAGGEASLEFSARNSTGPYGLVGASGGGLGGITQLSDSGSIYFNDVDLTDAHLVSANGTPIGSTLGTLTAVKVADTTGSGTGGQLKWTYNVANSAVQYLAQGETKVESFTVTLDDQHGGFITKQIDVTITGANDQPVVATADVTGAVTEPGTAIGNITDSGIIAFSDVDLTDVHSISNVTPSNGALGSLVATVSTDSTGSGTGGQITWNYSAPASALDYLAAGQTKVETFSFNLLDGQGGSVTRTVSITITGTNDAPEVAMTDITGAVTEQITASGNITDSGTIAFSDVDLSDAHSVSAITASAGALGTLTANVTTDTTGNGNGGVITWNYSVAGSAVEYLAAGQTKVETFSFNLMDGQGGIVTRTVNVTITGTNDAPVVASSDITGSVTELVVATGDLTDSGTIAFSDADLTDIHSISSITPSAGALGTLIANISTDSTGSGTGGVITWSYKVPASAVEYLAAGQTKLETFSFDVLDGQGGSVTRTVSVTVVGTNDAPIAINDSASATENGGAANGTLGSNAVGNVLNNDTDIDTAHSNLAVTAIRTGAVEGAGTAGVVGSTLVGNFGTLTIDSTGAYTYVINQTNPTVQALNTGGVLTDNFNYTVSDGSLSDNGLLSVTIRGSNDDPVAPDVTLQVNQLGNGGFDASPDFTGWRVSTATTGLTSGSGTATINRAGTAIAGDNAVAVLTFSGYVPSGYGTGYGPTITSNAFHGQAGDTVKFVYELTSGGDQAIGTGYIRDAQTNAIVQTIFNYQVPFSGSSGVKTVNLTLAQSGDFVIDFRVGSYDATGGLYVGATMKLGFAGIIRDGLLEDSTFTFAGTNFLSGVTDVDGGTPSLYSVSATSAANASVVLSGGNVIYDPRVALNHLAANQNFTDTFSYTVSDGKGGFDVATASVKVVGVNDIPEVATVDLKGMVTEKVMPIGNLTDSGTIAFTDVDLTDVHSISAVTASAGALGTLVANVSTDTTGTGTGGVITWNYVVPASAVEYLAAGETKIENFTFSLLDGNGGVVQRTVSVSINGTSEPINMWNADGNAIDQISANNGTLFNGASFAPGRTGQAFSFDGVNDFIRVNDTIRNDFTVTGWLKTTANSLTGNQFYQGNGLVYADVGGVANDFGISVLNNRIAFGTGNPDTTIQSNSIVTTGDWVQFAAVRSGSVISLYINGALESYIDTHNALTLNGPTAITFGGNTIDARYFSGLLDDVTFFDHALTATEIIGIATAPAI